MSINFVHEYQTEKFAFFYVVIETIDNTNKYW